MDEGKSIGISTISWRSRKNLLIQTKDPGFNFWLCHDLNICETFFSAKADSTFPYKVEKQLKANLRWIMSRPGGVKDSPVYR